MDIGITSKKLQGLLVIFVKKPDLNCIFYIYTSHFNFIDTELLAKNSSKYWSSTSENDCGSNDQMTELKEIRLRKRPK